MACGAPIGPSVVALTPVKPYISLFVDLLNLYLYIIQNVVNFSYDFLIMIQYSSAVYLYDCCLLKMNSLILTEVRMKPTINTSKKSSGPGMYSTVVDACLLIS